MRDINWEDIIVVGGGVLIIAALSAVTIIVLTLSVSHDSEVVRCESIGGKASFISGECYVDGEKK